jgi:hypothetical protein
MAFGLPVFKSGVIGFDNLGFIVNQRLLFLFLGLALVLATVLLFKRLPQSKLHRILTIIFLFIFTAGAVFCGFNTYSVFRDGVNDKELAIETNRLFENKNFSRITDATIELTHKGESIEASANLKIINDNNESLNKYYFSLNPSLAVREITSAGKQISYTRTNSIIAVDPGRILAQGQSDSILISYEGTINESFCYPNYNDNIKETPYRIEMVNVHKRQAFLNEKYVLLTPETYWYPIAALNYYPSNPARITPFGLERKKVSQLFHRER